MIAVFPFCNKEVEQERTLLKWVAEITPPSRHTALIFAANPVPEGVIREFAEIIKPVFNTVLLRRQAALMEGGWPFAPNAMFVEAARVMGHHPSPWLWIEPDCIPLKPNWLDAIEDEYRTAGKPFMGCVYDKPFPHLNGCAVYPEFVFNFNPKMIRPGRVPFDCVNPHLTLHHAHNTRLIQRSLVDPSKNTPHSFREVGDLKVIWPQAVLFHGCKDGTLIPMLRAAKLPKPSDTCVICLGRYGDIMGALPIARDLARKQKNPVAFMVAQEFASILDGVTYAYPHIFPDHYSKLQEAVALAKVRYKKVVRAQIFGAPEADRSLPVSYNLCAWKLAGYDKRWNDPTLQLEFDCRDKKRERKLLELNIQRDPRPIVLLCVTSGKSSVFDDGQKCKQRIINEFGNKLQIIDISAITASRIYDMLGFMEVASGLITTDTAPLHLASAHNVMPVFMLKPVVRSMQTETRCNCTGSLLYTEWDTRFDEIADWLDEKTVKPRFIHCYETHGTRNAREVRAQSTWEVMHNALGWIPVPFGEPYPRDSKAIGDPKGVPFVNDALAKALVEANSDMDIIVLTNSDIILLPEIERDILGVLARSPAMCSSRRDIKDFSEVKRQPDSPRHLHAGRDLFAFRAWWLRKLLAEMPLMFIGRNDWDNLALNIIRRETGTLIPGGWGHTQSFPVADCEIASPNVMHEDHLPWADNPEKTKLTSNQWNWANIGTWQRKYLPTLTFPYTDKWHADWHAGRLSFKTNTYEKTLKRIRALLTA